MIITARQRRRRLTLGASRCLLLFFSVLPRDGGPICIRHTTYRNRRRRFKGCCRRPGGAGRCDAGAKCRTWLLGEERRPIDPAHTANGKRSAAETSRASRFSSVRKAASSLSLFTVLFIIFLNIFSRRSAKSTIFHFNKTRTKYRDA